MQSEALPRSESWHVISKEFLRSFFRRHSVGKQVVACWNVSCFLRPLTELFLSIVFFVWTWYGFFSQKQTNRANLPHTIFISWNHKLLTPCTISKIVVGSQPTAIIGIFFHSCKLPVMMFRLGVDKMLVSEVELFTGHMESDKYSMYRMFWNISPKDSNSCWAQIMTPEIGRWAWWG